MIRVHWRTLHPGHGFTSSRTSVPRHPRLSTNQNINQPLEIFWVEMDAKAISSLHWTCQWSSLSLVGWQMRQGYHPETPSQTPRTPVPEGTTFRISSLRYIYLIHWPCPPGFLNFKHLTQTCCLSHIVARSPLHPSVQRTMCSAPSELGAHQLPPTPCGSCSNEQRTLARLVL